MNKKDRAILYGMAIGDGHITHRHRLKDGKYPYEQSEMILGHGPAQRGYLQHKARVLQKIFGGKELKVSDVHHTLKATGKTYLGHRVAKTNPYFRQMHKVLYKEGKKKLTPQVLSYLDEVSLAYWFMDDGNIIHNTSKDGNITSVFFRICTQFDSEEEADLVVDWFWDRWGIKAKKYPSKGRWDLGGGTKATLALAGLVFDHLHPDLFYKLKSVAKLTICKSARHPEGFTSLDEDIVQSVESKIDSVGL